MDLCQSEETFIPGPLDSQVNVALELLPLLQRLLELIISKLHKNDTLRMARRTG